MARVHSFDQYSAVEIALETTWGTVQTTGFKRVYPMADPGESGQLIRTQIPTAQEFTSLGARTAYDYGRKTVQGSISIVPAYKSEAFGILLKELHGGRIISNTAGKAPNGSTPGGTPSGYTSHAFLPQVFTDTTANYVGGVGKGLTIRGWKSGASTGGTVDRFVGCIVTGLSWEQRAGAVPIATFSFVGAQLDPVAASGESLAAVPAGLVLMQYRDFKRQNTSVQTVCQGTASLFSAEINLDSFTFSGQGGIEVPPSFITAPDTVSKPFHSGQWNGGVEIQSRLQHDLGGVAHPAYTTDSIADVATILRLRYVSATMAYDGGSPANRMPYAFELEFPACFVTASSPNLTSIGPGQHPLSITGIKGTAAASAHSFTSDQTGPWVVQLISSFASF